MIGLLGCSFQHGCCNVFKRALHMDEEAGKRRDPGKSRYIFKNSSQVASTPHFFPPSFMPRSAYPAHATPPAFESLRHSALRRSFIDRGSPCDLSSSVGSLSSLSSLSSSIDSVASLDLKQTSLVGRNVVIVLDPWFFCQAVKNGDQQSSIRISRSALGLLNSILSQLRSKAISYTILFYMHRESRSVGRAEELQLRYPYYDQGVWGNAYAYVNDFIRCISHKIKEPLTERNIVYVCSDIFRYNPTINLKKRGVIMLTDQPRYIDYAHAHNIHCYGRRHLVPGLIPDKLYEITNICRDTSSKEPHYVCVSLDALIDNGSLSYLGRQLIVLSAFAKIYVIEHKSHPNFFEHCKSLLKEINITYDEFSKVDESYFFYGFLSENLMMKKTKSNIVYYVGNANTVSLLRENSQLDCMLEPYGALFNEDVVSALYEECKPSYASVVQRV